jgi:hypothetical protein
MNIAAIIKYISKEKLFCIAVVLLIVFFDVPVTANTEKTINDVKSEVMLEDTFESLQTGIDRIKYRLNEKMDLLMEKIKVLESADNISTDNIESIANDYLLNIMPDIFEQSSRLRKIVEEGLYESAEDESYIIDEYTEVIVKHDKLSDNDILYGYIEDKYKTYNEETQKNLEFLEPYIIGFKTYLGTETQNTLYSEAELIRKVRDDFEGFISSEKVTDLVNIEKEDIKITEWISDLKISDDRMSELLSDATKGGIPRLVSAAEEVFLAFIRLDRLDSIPGVPPETQDDVAVYSNQFKKCLDDLTRLTNLYDGLEFLVDGSKELWDGLSINVALDTEAPDESNDVTFTEPPTTFNLELSSAITPDTSINSTGPSTNALYTPIISPNIYTELLDEPTESPDAVSESPDASTESPDTSTESPDAATESPDASTESPDAATESPDTSTESPDAATESPDTSTESPDTATESQDTSAESPDAVTEAPNMSAIALMPTHPPSPMPGTVGSLGYKTVSEEKPPTNRRPERGSDYFAGLLSIVSNWLWLILLIIAMAFVGAIIWIGAIIYKRRKRRYEDEQGSTDPPVSHQSQTHPITQPLLQSKEVESDKNPLVNEKWGSSNLFNPDDPEINQNKKNVEGLPQAKAPLKSGLSELVRAYNIAVTDKYRMEAFMADYRPIMTAFGVANEHSDGLAFKEIGDFDKVCFWAVDNKMDGILEIIPSLKIINSPKATQSFKDAQIDALFNYEGVMDMSYVKLVKAATIKYEGDRKNNTILPDSIKKGVLE